MLRQAPLHEMIIRKKAWKEHVDVSGNRSFLLRNVAITKYHEQSQDN